MSSPLISSQGVSKADALLLDIASFRGPLSDSHCKSEATHVGFMLAITAWTSVMTLRACALWHQHKYLVRAVWALWAIVVITLVALAHVAWKQVRCKYILSTGGFHCFYSLIYSDHDL